MRKWLIAPLAVLAALALGLCLRQWVAGTVRVAGTSMQRTLYGGDIALVTRFDYRHSAPERGDVVECRFPGRSDTYIKRVIGLPGDEISFFGGALTLNGQPVRESYVSSATEDYAVTLGEDEYLVLGDNRADSYDSRMADMGPIGAEAFLGRVRWVLWPLSRIGPVK
ncbi:MAG: signal peptidase I [Clostridia bacterium]|nr:signal peptidase I [Clostridia bacterium]